MALLKRLKIKKKSLRGFLIFIFIFILVTSAVRAAEETRSIVIQVLAKEQIQLKGSVRMGELTEIALADIQQKKPINLGTFGIETGIQANCHLYFTSSNHYRLQQIANSKNDFMAYKLRYNGQLIDKPTKIMTACNGNHGLLILIPIHKITNPAESIDGSIDGSIDKGAYQDKLRVVVTMP